MNYSRRQLYALGEPIGESSTRLKLGGRIYGGGGGGSAATPDKTTQTTELPEWARPYAKDTLAKGAALTDINQNPYQTYGANRIAGFSPMQQQAFQGAANMQSPEQLGTATDLAKAAGVGALGTNYQGGRFSGGTFGQGAADFYMNPYQQNVTDIGKREAARQSNILGTQQAGQATQAGAFGGSRFGVQQAERERNLGQQMNDIQAQGQNAAFTNAQQQFNADQARRMQAQQLGEQSRQYGAGLGLQGLQTGLQAAGQLGQLGGQQFQQGMDINKLQSAYGGQMQQQAQRPLDQAYQDFQNQQNYPYKQLGFMSDMIRGLPLGQQSTSSIYSQGPSTVQTLAGLGGAAYGFGKSGLFAEGGEVKTYAGDRGSVTSQDNKNAIVENTYSIPSLRKSKEAALARRDTDTANAIDERIAELNAIQAQSASIDRGLGSAFDQIPEERQEQMMAGGGVVAFAGGGSYGSKFEDSLTSLTDMANQQPAIPSPEQYEEGVTARQPMLEKMYGEDITKPYLEETKSKRAGLADQMEKDKGLAFAMASLGLLSRKKNPGENQKQQLVSGLGEAGQMFAGEVAKLKKENIAADDKLRQSELLIATAQQQRKEGMVNKAMSLEDKAEAQKQEAFKIKLGVQEKVAQFQSGLASHEISADASKYAADQGLKGHLASAAAHRYAADKPGEIERMVSDYENRLGRKLNPEEYQKVVGEMGAARYGAKYTGPDRSFEHSAEVQKLVKDNPEAKAIGLELLRPNLTEEKKEELRQRLRTIADTIAGDIERRKQSPGAAPSTNAPAAVPGAPRPGTVKDGYRFKGGDPSNPTSWEKV